MASQTLPTTNTPASSLTADLRRPALWRTGWIKDIRQHWALYLMALPAVIAIVLFGYGPLSSLSIAFLNFSPARGLGGSTFVGLDNFRTAFANPFFLTALRNTLVINSLKLAVGFPAAVILALLLNEIRSAWFKRIVQTATILPYFIGWVVVATMFRNILAPDGMINEIVTHVFGAQPIIFPSDPQKFPLIIVF